MHGFFVLLCVATLHNCLAEQIFEAEGLREQRSPTYAASVGGLFTSGLKKDDEEDDEARKRRSSPLSAAAIASLAGKRAISDAAEEELEIGEARARRDSELRGILHALGGKRDILAVLGNELEAAETRKRRSPLNPKLLGSLVGKREV